jgi:hypothetical protein
MKPIIHTIRDSQDIRFVGNLSIQIPLQLCAEHTSDWQCGLTDLSWFTPLKDNITLTVKLEDKQRHTTTCGYSSHLIFIEL